MFICLGCERPFMPIDSDCIKSLCRLCGESEYEENREEAIRYWGSFEAEKVSDIYKGGKDDKGTKRKTE